MRIAIVALLVSSISACTNQVSGDQSKSVKLDVPEPQRTQDLPPVPDGYIWASGSDSADLYIHQPSVRTAGNMRDAWVMTDVTDETDESGYRSFRALERYDCDERRVRQLSVSTGFSDRRLTGEPTQDARVDDRWKFVPPGTVSEGVLDFVCGL